MQSNKVQPGLVAPTPLKADSASSVFSVDYHHPSIGWEKLTIIRDDKNNPLIWFAPRGIDPDSKIVRLNVGIDRNRNVRVFDSEELMLYEMDGGVGTLTHPSDLIQPCATLRWDSKASSEEAPGLTFVIGEGDKRKIIKIHIANITGSSEKDEVELCRSGSVSFKELFHRSTSCKVKIVGTVKQVQKLEDTKAEFQVI